MNMMTCAKDTILILKVIVTSLPSLFDRLQTACYYWILLKVTCEGEVSYQYQLVYLLY